MKKSSTTKRKPAKSAGTSKRATTPSASKSKPAATSPKAQRKGRALVHVEPKNAPPAPAEAAPPPPTRAASAPSVDAVEEALAPGDPIDGYRLARAIRYAAKVTPKEDGLVVFTHLEGPLPLVSGHDQRRAHTGFFAAKSAFHLHAAVPREDALAFADYLEGLSWPRVRIAADGMAIVRHGTAQPAGRFDLGHRDITQRWLPPTQEGRRPAVGPLRISASWQGAACRWGKAISRTYQSADGIEWVELSDDETGELLARAVLAEDGKDIFPEDERQTEIPGSRTAGSRPDAAPRAPTPSPAVAPTLRAPAGDDSAAPASGGVTIEADGLVVSVDDGGEPAPAFPTPGARPVVVEIPADLFDALTDAQREALRIPATVPVWWFVGPEVVTSSSMDATSANAAAGLLLAAGLRCVTMEAASRHGTEVDLWTITRTFATKAEG